MGGPWGSGAGGSSGSSASRPERSRAAAAATRRGRTARATGADDVRWSAPGPAAGAPRKGEAATMGGAGAAKEPGLVASLRGQTGVDRASAGRCGWGLEPVLAEPVPALAGVRLVWARLQGRLTVVPAVAPLKPPVAWRAATGPLWSRCQTRWASGAEPGEAPSGQVPGPGPAGGERVAAAEKSLTRGVDQGRGGPGGSVRLAARLGARPGPVGGVPRGALENGRPAAGPDLVGRDAVAGAADGPVGAPWKRGGGASDCAPAAVTGPTGRARSGAVTGGGGGLLGVSAGARSGLRRTWTAPGSEAQETVRERSSSAAIGPRRERKGPAGVSGPGGLATGRRSGGGAPGRAWGRTSSPVPRTGRHSDRGAAVTAVPRPGGRWVGGVVGPRACSTVGGLSGNREAAHRVVGARPPATGAGTQGAWSAAAGSAESAVRCPTGGRQPRSSPGKAIGTAAIRETPVGGAGSQDAASTHSGMLAVDAARARAATRAVPARGTPGGVGPGRLGSVRREGVVGAAVGASGGSWSGGGWRHR